MNAKKLSRRERALIQHARRQAVAEYKAATTFRLEVPRHDAAGTRLVLHQYNLATLENLNVLMGEPVFFVSLVSRWRR